MKNLLFIKTFIFVLFLLAGCTPQKQVVRKPMVKKQATKPSIKKERTPLPKTVYYVKQDGEFVDLELEKGPLPIQGKDQWIKDFYLGMKYPAIARENGITGIVILSIIVNELGIVESVDIKKSLSKECDAEAKRAYIQSTLKGFEPFVYTGNPAIFKLELPVGFWLQ